MLRPPLYPTRPDRYPSPRSGLTRADVVAARAPTRGADTHTKSEDGEKPAALKSEAEEFRQAIRIDIGGLEMLAQEGKGPRLEAARRCCELQHSLVALTTASAADKLAALDDIGVAVHKLHVQFPGVFTKAKDLVISTREALFVSSLIESLKSDLAAVQNPALATLMLDGSCAMLARLITSGPTEQSFKDCLRDELYRSLHEVKMTHSDGHIRERLAERLTHYPVPGRPADADASSGPSASDIASLRAAESTKVTWPPLRMHAQPAGPASSVEQFLEQLSPLQSSDLRNRLLTGEVAMLIDEIVLRRSPGEDVLLAKLGAGLNELRLTHEDPEMRAELSKALKCYFEQPRETSPIRAVTGEKRLRMRAAFLLAGGPKMAPGAKYLEDFAFRLADDINRELGHGSGLMLKLLDALERSPALEQLGEAIYLRNGESG